MALYKGDCETCGRINVEIFDYNDKCVTCTRLDNLEKEVDKLNKRLNKWIGIK